MSPDVLGRLADANAGRDAVHVAIAPVVCADKYLLPGERIGLVNGRATKKADAIGVVDPFLQEPVANGERFYIALFPGSIESLRHEWTHKAFEQPTVSHDDHVEKSKAWIAHAAEVLDMTVNQLMEAARKMVEHGEHTVQYDSQHWRDSWHGALSLKDFWHHYEIVTETKVPDHEKSFFCCSC